jgi:hypothetical protein
MEVPNTLVYYDTATVFVQVPGINKYSIEFHNRTAQIGPNAWNQLSYPATDVFLTLVLKKMLDIKI